MEKVQEATWCSCGMLINAPSLGDPGLTASIKNWIEDGRWALALHTILG
jgi:hypothetical protein